MTTPENLQAHYAAVRARLRGNADTPTRAVVLAKIPFPPPSQPALSPGQPVTQPEPELSYEDQIKLTRRRLEGMTGLSNRRKLLLLPILEEHKTYWPLIAGGARKRNLVAARHDIYVALHNDGMGLAAIGRATNRDHTTILHSLRKDPELNTHFKRRPRNVQFQHAQHAQKPDGTEVQQ